MVCDSDGAGGGNWKLDPDTGENEAYGLDSPPCPIIGKSEPWKGTALGGATDIDAVTWMTPLVTLANGMAANPAISAPLEPDDASPPPATSIAGSPGAT